MARERAALARHHITPTRLQDGTGLEDRIGDTIIDEFIAPIDERVTVLETAVSAIGRNIVTEADVQLRAGYHGGTTFIEPEGGFDEDAVGRPVMMNQGASGDSDEGGIVSFTGEVVSVKQLRVRWFSATPAPARVKVVYLIG